MRRLLLLVVVVALAGAGYWWFVLRAAARPTDAQRGKPDIPVLLATAASRDVPIYLDGLGTVQASATVTVRPQVDGTLVEVRFREGQDVRKGDILARIDPRTYQAAVDQAVAKKAQDQANLANARVDLTRYQKLAATAYTSAQQADTQRASVAQLEAQVAQDQAQIDTARVQLGYTSVVAPIDGRTGIRQVDQGNLVHAADTTGIVVLTTLKPIDLVFTLPQQSLRAVTQAMAAGAMAAGTMAAGAMAAGAPEVLALAQEVSARPEHDALDHGTLTVLDNQVDAATGTIKLKATFPNERQQLWPGAFVTARLRVQTDRAATTVPTVAVQRGPQGSFVWVVGQDLHATRRSVSISHEDVGISVVGDGLAPGERVVVDGAARLTDDVRVAVADQPAPAAPADAQKRERRRKPAATDAS